MATLSYEQVDAYFLAKPGTRATYPFDETTRVYKVLGKMYGLILRGCWRPAHHPEM